MAVHFIVPGEPRGKGRPRFAKRGRFISTYTDTATALYEATVADAGLQAMGSTEPLQTPISLRIEAYMTVPSSWSRAKRLDALAGMVVPGKPDLDNVAKAVMDALNGVLYEDDKQVCALRVAKWYALDPRVEVYAHEVLP